MKIRRKKLETPRKIILTLILLVPVAFGGTYLGVYLGIMVPELTSFMSVPPGTEDFEAIEDINITRLEELGTEFEHRQELHIPINLSQAISFNATTGEVMLYHHTDNGALHTAENLIASCLRYATLPAGAEKDYSLYLIRRMLDSLRLLIEVPNGGLGPEYPGTSIGRFYASPAQRNDGNYTWMFNEHFRHFNGTGKYSDWRIRLYTSKDEYGGYFGAIAALQALVDVPDVQNVTRLIILQAMEGLLSSYWRVVSGDGKPNGAHFQFPSQAAWKILLTKMAIKADPTNAKYKRLLQYFLVHERKVNQIPKTGGMDNIDNYYGPYFSNLVVLGLFLVEDNQNLLDLYFKNFEEDTYINFRGHRNAFQNALYLIATSRTTRTASFNLTEIRWDILDQLWRFESFGLFPFDTTCGGLNRTTNRTSLDASWQEIDPNIAKWRNFVETTVLGNMYKWLVDELQDNILEDRYLRPATVDMMNVDTDIIWNRSPYREDGENNYDTSEIIRERASAAFTLPFYMLKYAGYLEGI